MFLQRSLLFCALLGAMCRAVCAQDEAAPQPKPLTPAEAMQLFAPASVSLQADDMEVFEAFKSLARQAKRPFTDSNYLKGNEKVTLQIAPQSFWKVALELQKKTGHGLFWSTTSSGLNEPYRYSLARYANHAGGLERENGPLLVYLGNITRTRTTTSVFNFAQTPGAAPATTQGDELKVLTSAYLDPQIPIVAGSPRLELVEAVDENGRSIFETGARSRGWEWRVEHTFSTTETQGLGRKIARLKLGYRALVALESQTLQWDNVFETDAQTKVGARGDGVENYEVSEGKNTPRGFSLKIKANRPIDGMSFDEASRALFPEVKLIDAAGKTWFGNASSIRDRVDKTNPAVVRNFESTVSFGRAGDTFAAPLKFVWTVPSRVRPLEAQFEWNDVPLP